MKVCPSGAKVDAHEVAVLGTEGDAVVQANTSFSQEKLVGRFSQAQFAAIQPAQEGGFGFAPMNAHELGAKGFIQEIAVRLKVTVLLCKPRVPFSICCKGS